MLGVVTENHLLRIGEFARASWLSIKALRAYHEIGLLVPAEGDAHIGYRPAAGRAGGDGSPASHGASHGGTRRSS